MTKIYDLQTAWGHFLKMSNSNIYQCDANPPATLSRTEGSKIKSEIQKIINEHMTQLYNKVFEHFKTFGEEKENILFFLELFNFGNSFRREKISKFSSHDLYKMTRCLGFQSMQQALFGQPCDIRCTTNDEVFLNYIQSFSDPDRDMVELSIKQFPDIISLELSGKIDAKKEEYVKCWKHIPAGYSSFVSNYGRYWEYSNCWTKSMFPLIKYRVCDRAAQNGISIDKRFLPSETALSCVEKYSFSFPLIKAYLFGLSFNMGLDELLLPNSIRNGFGRVYIKNVHGECLQLNDEERKWVSYIHALPLNLQNEILVCLITRQNSENVIIWG